MAAQGDRRSAILRCSADLFAKQGVASTTVRQIADEVGVLSGSLYHHFPSKDAIVNEIVTAYLDQLLSRYREVMRGERAPRERLEQLIAASLLTAESEPSATLIYQNEMSYIRELPQYEAVKAAAAEVQQTWMTVIEQGRADGTFRDDIDPRVFYRFVRDAVWLSVRWYRAEGPYTVSQLAADCASIFLDGYAAFED
ncbi:TetR/AcrR family transcriptional regulator [Pseudonocardia lacus]|uniref:TetR/AcrR family transcriptional regulator n=1 Tax=Pseudonocardia lacus TaxID=2835865 RepID=UPI001BDC1B07|nr:TetR/AcrR family transcriptional regulator [Pseudonocardia lacus]